MLFFFFFFFFFAGRRKTLLLLPLKCEYVVKKRHEQVEKTLEMKKWSRNGSSNETSYR